MPSALHSVLPGIAQKTPNLLILEAACPLCLPLPPSEIDPQAVNFDVPRRSDEEVEQEQQEEAADGSGVREALGASPQHAGLVQPALGVQARSTGHEARDRALRAVQVDVLRGERRSSRGGRLHAMRSRVDQAQEHSDRSAAEKGDQVMLTRRRIVKAPVLRKPTPCPVCRSRRGSA